MEKFTINEKKKETLDLQELGSSIQGLFNRLQSKSLSQLLQKPGRKSLNVLKVALASSLLTISACDKTTDNFSGKNVEEQREWLVDWISNRGSLDAENFSENDLTKLKETMLLNVKNVKIGYDYLEKGIGGKYTEKYGVGKLVVFNLGEKRNERFKNVPGHEMTHAAYDGEVFIPEQYKKIISECVKSEKDFIELGKKDTAVRKNIQRLWDPDKFFSEGRYAYATNSSEFLSFLMDFRKELGLLPRQKIGDEEIKKILLEYKSGKLNFVGSYLIINLIKNQKSLKRVLNEIVLNENQRKSLNSNSNQNWA